MSRHVKSESEEPVFFLGEQGAVAVLNGVVGGSLGDESERLPLITPCVTIQGVIRSFADSQTEKLFQRERSRAIPADLRRRALRKLLILDATSELSDLETPPGKRLEKLKGDRKGQHSIRINEQWRICFLWASGDVLDVEIVDYH